MTLEDIEEAHHSYWLPVRYFAHSYLQILHSSGKQPSNITPSLYPREPPFSVPGEENLTPEERHIYPQLFKAADIDGKGIVLGDEAVEFFKKSGLPSHVLSEVCMVALWQFFFFF